MTQKASFNNLSELLEKCNLTYKEWMKYVNDLTKANVILMKPDPKDWWADWYNRDLLRAWNANMDIQFVLKAASCTWCLMCPSWNMRWLRSLIQSFVMCGKQMWMSEMRWSRWWRFQQTLFASVYIHRNRHTYSLKQGQQSWAWNGLRCP